MIVKWWFARVLLLVTFDCAHNSKIAFLMLQIFPKPKQLAVVKETFQIYFMWLRAQGIGMKFQYVSMQGLLLPLLPLYVARMRNSSKKNKWNSFKEISLIEIDD